MSYPTDLPVAEIKEVISIITGGQIATKSKELVRDLYVIEGYALGQIVGEPDAQLMLSSAPIESHDDFVARLQAALPTEGVGAGKVDWKAFAKYIVNLLPTLLPLILG